MNPPEKARISIAIHMAKQDLKERWGYISPSSRSAIRSEFGDWMNTSKISEDEILFLDHFNYW